MNITDDRIAHELRTHLDRHPHEQAALADAVRLVATGTSLASRDTLPLHVTAGALLVRGGAEVLLIEHRAYGIWLQPGGHLEPEDADLPSAALRELVEETGIDPTRIGRATAEPVYVECARVPSRPDRGEPAHRHLDFGYLFTTDDRTGVGHLQDEEVTGAAWYPLHIAARLAGPRMLRPANPGTASGGGSGHPAP